jgi:hypothetical protein
MAQPDAGRGEVLLHVLSAPDGDAEELAAMTASLLDELLDLDIAAAEPVYGDAPVGSKGALAAVGGWLVVNLGPAALRSVVRRLVAWAAHNDRTVEISVAGDVLKVTGVNEEQQNRLIDEWLTRQAART